MSDGEQFKVWESSRPLKPGMLSQPRGATLRVSDRTCKTASFSEYGNVRTGTVSKRELTLTTAKRLPEGNFDWAQPESKWVGQDEEIDKLVAFLNDESIAAGRYRLGRVL